MIAIVVPAMFGYLADFMGLRLSMILLLIPVIVISIAFVWFYLRSNLEHLNWEKLPLIKFLLKPINR